MPDVRPSTTQNLTRPSAKRVRRRAFWWGFLHPFASRRAAEEAVEWIAVDEGFELPQPGGDRPGDPWWRFILPGRFRAWCAYHHALDDVWDLALDDNPCHDRVREFIARRREEVPRV